MTSLRPLSRARSAPRDCGQDLMLLQVDVYRMGPVAGEIGQKPLLQLFCCTVKRKLLQSINWPLIDHWPFKRSNLNVRKSWASRGAGQLVESWIGRGVNAVICHRGPAHAELQHQIACARRAESRVDLN